MRRPLDLLQSTILIAMLVLIGVVTTSPIAAAQNAPALPEGHPKVPGDSDGDSRQQSGALQSALAGLEVMGVENEEELLENFSKQSSSFEHLFDTALVQARQSLVVVRSAGYSRSKRARKRQIALGTVVSSDGLVLTKASEMRGNLFCEFSDGEVLPAKLMGLEPAFDMALLKVDRTDLTVADWDQGSSPRTGQWLATPLDHQGDVDTGIVSVNLRVIPPSKPFIGIFMENAKPTGVRVLNVQSNSPADQCGLRPNDIIMKLDQYLTRDIDSLRSDLEQFDAGDLVTLSVLRDDVERTMKLTLAERDKVSSENMRSNQQNSMGSRLSRRRKNFPAAFQHDSTLQSSDCGGPIVNLDGKIVGINIARGGRVASLAVAVQDLLPVVEKLATGNYPPEIANADRIAKVEAEIQKAQEARDRLSDTVKKLKDQQDTVEGTRAGLQIAADDIQKRLDDLMAEIRRKDSKLKDSDAELLRLQKLIRELERDYKRLSTGLR